MKFCNQCGSPISDDQYTCANCGTVFSAPSPGEAPSQPQQPASGYTAAPPQHNSAADYGGIPPQYQQPPYQQPQYQTYDPFDHTSEFDSDDISKNKVIAMLPYIMGPLGIIIALLAASGSPYTAFHVRQAMKIEVCSVVAGLAAGILAFTVLVPIAAGIFIIIMTVLSIIGFFQVCSGMAKEPAIIKNFKFLR